ncbi:hypothetical protein [Bradyrhizobium cosmicum]|uniref:Uncharacterized protein n=1 Tax=Bradyrhizobium cosmicum TaxID=1404864 RepID=A0AAI8MA76_9BRAD|nr:hypothetical protein [Bradyrhizobium cosmicum]BAL74672.1 hypothetical protein S23_14550 [Bradyrhizobium cosmicum]
MGSAISDTFIKDLQDGGLLSELTKKIQSDDTLMLALRGHYINVYYRGGSILHISEQANGYAAKFDTNYFEGEVVALPPATIQAAGDCSNWVAVLPKLKETMNAHFATRRKSEREFQQLAAWENNRSVISNDTEYFITDIEFADRDQGAKLDMVGLKWPSGLRKDETKCKPVLVEMKYGTGSYDGAAGIAKHIADLEGILANPVKREGLNKTIADQFEQLLQLKLVGFNKHANYSRAIVSGRPEVIFLIANHNPRSRKLLNIVEEIVEPKDFDLRFFAASFAGYGMHDACMLDLGKFKALLKQLAG